MEMGLDPVAYERITDHSYAMAMKHYQIPHTKRLQTGYAKVFEAWSLKNRCDNLSEAEESPSKHEVKPTSELGLKNGLVGGLNEDLRCIPYDSENSQQNSLDPRLYESTQEMKKRVRELARARYRGTGIRTPTK